MTDDFDAVYDSRYQGQGEFSLIFTKRAGGDDFVYVAEFQAGGKWGDRLNVATFFKDNSKAVEHWLERHRSERSSAGGDPSLPKPEGDERPFSETADPTIADPLENDNSAPRFARRPSPPGQGALDLAQTPTFALDEASALDRWRRKFQDNKLDLQRVQDAIQQSGTVIREPNDAYLADTLYKGRVSEATKAFHKARTEPLLRAIAAAKLTLDDVGQYLWARHAEERNAAMRAINTPHMPGYDQLSGMSDADAQRIRAEKRAGSGHRQVVHRAVHRQASDVPAGKFQGFDGKAVGGHQEFLGGPGDGQVILPHFDGHLPYGA